MVFQKTFSINLTFHQFNKVGKMKTKIIFLFCLLFVLNGCTLPQLDKETPSVNEVGIHTKFRINLPENHTTGYLWQLNQNFDKALLEEMNAVWHGNEKGIDFNFKSLKVGETTLTFVLRKHTDTSNVKSFVVKIIDK